MRMRRQIKDRNEEEEENGATFANSKFYFKKIR